MSRPWNPAAIREAAEALSEALDDLLEAADALEAAPGDPGADMALSTVLIKLAGPMVALTRALDIDPASVLPPGIASRN